MSVADIISLGKEIRCRIYTCLNFNDLVNLRKTAKLIYVECENLLYKHCRLVINCSSNVSVLDKKPLHLVSEIHILRDTNLESICQVFSHPMLELKKLVLVILSVENNICANISILLKNCLNLESLNITGPRSLFQTPLYTEKLPLFSKLETLCLSLCYCTNEFIVDFVLRCPVLKLLLSQQNFEVNRDLVLTLYHRFGISLNKSSTEKFRNYKFAAHLKRLKHNMAEVFLKSKDGETFPLSISAAKLSNTVKTLLSVMEDDDTEPIPVLEVDAKILRIVVEWMKQMADAEGKEHEHFEEFEKKLFDMDISTVYAVIMAANYMDVEKLLKRACTEVAMRIEGKSTVEMREILGIKNDWHQNELRSLDDETSIVAENK